MKSPYVSAGEYNPQNAFWATACLCLLSLAGNIAAAFLASALYLPLFSDTIFTVAITLFPAYLLQFYTIL